MKVRYLTLLACTAAATALLTTYPQSPAPVFSAQAAGTIVPERVRIEHRLVRIHDTTRSPAANTSHVSRRVQHTPAPVRLAIARASADPAEAPEQPHFLRRTMRKIVGDGRHSPQPFPRPDR